MKIPPHLRRLAFFGLLGLGCATAVLAVDEGCTENSLESPAGQIARCNGGFADLPRLAAVYQKRLGLPADVAGGLAAALAEWQGLAERRDRDQPAFDAEVRRVESEFINLLDRAPASTKLAGELAWFYVSQEWGGRAPAPALLDRVARSADPVGLAGRLAEHDDWRPGAEIRLAALAVRPEAAALWQQVSFDIVQTSWRLAFREEAYRQVAAGAAGRPADPDLVTAAAEAWLAAELDAGLAAPAVATFEGLPPALRTRILRGGEGDVKAAAGGLPFEERMRDLRLPLAGAYLLTGDAKTAAGILAGLVPPSAAEQQKDATRKGGEVARQAMLRWLHPTADDPFDLLTSLLAASTLDSGAGIGWQLEARLAEREGYPAIAAHFLKALVDNTSLEDEGFEPERVPARVRASAVALRGEIAKLHHGLAEEMRADREAVRETLGPDPAAATVDRLLRQPAAVRFAEKPLPEGVRPIELEWQEVGKRQKAMAAEVTLPAGFGMIRAERQGDRAVAIGVSQDLDPVGEVSAGAYWVILSSDGGRTWDPPLYTGLRVNQPYVVKAVSDLPLLADGHLRHLWMEVEIAEIDDTRITFPPIALATKRTAKGLYLDIPLDLLEQDSDGDGLTDLAEERLLTDPASRDTDGDGLEDAVDPLPAIPFQRGAQTAPSRALAAFIADLWKGGMPALVEGVSGGPQPLGGVVGTRTGGSPLDRKTLFLVADRAPFATLSPGRRVVVLTPGEMEAAEKKLGPFFPTRLELFVFDRSGRRAYAVWSASWEGGQTRLEENADGSWKATRTTEWIT